MAHWSVCAAGGAVREPGLHSFCIQISLRQETGISMDPFLLFFPPRLTHLRLRGRGGGGGE